MAQPTRLFATKPADCANFAYEEALTSQGFQRIAGCDEVGRGPLAGPVVAASVILPEHADPSVFRDSKQLSHKQRLELGSLLEELGAPVGIGIVPVTTIDSINILQASLLAMRYSLEDLATKGPGADYVLVDGKFAIPLDIPQQPLIKGESKSGSIAAASIVAKLARDAIMEQLDGQYPQYGFARHKGYATKLHRRSIADHGPCPEHRTTFSGVKEFVR